MGLEGQQPGRLTSAVEGIQSIYSIQPCCVRVSLKGTRLESFTVHHVLVIRDSSK